MPRRRAWERTAAALALGAAVVHGTHAPAHMAERWGDGLFFLLAAVSQAVLGLAIGLDAFESRALRRGVHVAGALGSLALAATYVFTRAFGVPFAPADSPSVRAWDVLGLATTAAELATAGILLRLALARID